MIRVGFSHVNGYWYPLSWLMMKIMRKPYSHCWILLDGSDSIFGVPMVLEESESGGLHFTPFALFYEKNTIVKIVSPEYSILKGVEALMSKLTEDYDILGLLGEGIVVGSLRWFHRKIKNPFRNPQFMWCSEAVAFALEKSNYPGVPVDWWVGATPSQVDWMMHE